MKNKKLKYFISKKIMTFKLENTKKLKMKNTQSTVAGKYQTK